MTDLGLFILLLYDSEKRLFSEYLDNILLLGSNSNGGILG